MDGTCITKGMIHRLLLSWILALALLPTAAPQSASRSDTAQPTQVVGPLDVLSDTKGVDFGPYLARVLHDVRQNWFSLIPEQAHAPVLKKGRVSIEFVILKDGKVAGMHYVDGSGDVALDRAAYGGITASNPFPPLPSEFGGPYLALRFHFNYNPDSHDLSATPADARSKAGVMVSISPRENLWVLPGESQAFTASVTGTSNNTVKWGVSGPGCTGSGCGQMIGYNLYLANTLPNPPFVTITASSEADPNARDSVTLKLVNSAPVVMFPSPSVVPPSVRRLPNMGPVDSLSNLPGRGGVIAPRAIFSPKPEYSQEGKDAKLEGTVILSVLIAADGTVHNIEVVQQLGRGLDEKAVEAVRLWKFTPAMLKGQPVAVQISVQVDFHLYGK